MSLRGKKPDPNLAGPFRSPIGCDYNSSTGSAVKWHHQWDYGELVVERLDRYIAGFIIRDHNFDVRTQKGNLPSAMQGSKNPVYCLGPGTAIRETVLIG
jgi:hypothetical protein